MHACFFSLLSSELSDVVDEVSWCFVSISQPKAPKRSLWIRKGVTVGVTPISYWSLSILHFRTNDGRRILESNIANSFSYMENCDRYFDE